MDLTEPFQWILGALLVLSAGLVLFFRRPVHASLSFLLTLVLLAATYLRLSASFMAVMQILIYAGAILVIFMFVMVLFQDAHEQIDRYPARSSKALLTICGATILCSIAYLGFQIFHLTSSGKTHPEGFGNVEGLGKALYLDFFFPFEAIILLFLVAMVGAFYIARREGR
jgi:NADH-quinone oxidoreductase subunit J